MYLEGIFIMKQLDLFEDSEIWVNIAEYGDKYQICNIGEKVRNKDGKILYTQIHNNGYYMVLLCNSGKKKLHTIHRLKALAFIPNPNNLPCVNHKDGIRINNNLSNYEWTTKRINIRDGVERCLNKGEKYMHNQRFVKEDVIEIRKKYSDGYNIKYLSELYKTKVANISNIVNRKTWNYEGM